MGVQRTGAKKKKCDVAASIAISVKVAALGNHVDLEGCNL